MQYNLANELDKRRFMERARSLADRGRLVELTEKALRSRAQNAYLHAIIGVVAMETGNTLAYTKDTYFKRLVNHATFLVEKDDPLAGKVTVVRSSADLTKEEMSTAIDRFKRWAYENGMYLPEPGDEALLRDIEIEMGRNAAYL